MRDNRVTGTSKHRRLAAIGCGGALALMAVVIGVGLALEPEPVAPVSGALPAPRVAISTDLLPVVNVDLRFAQTASDARLIEQVAGSTRQVAEQLLSSPPKGQAVSFVNFLVYAGEDQLLLHYTIPGPAMRKAATSRRSPAFYLTLTNEAGANADEGRAAIRAYCGITAIAFCMQSDD